MRGTILGAYRSIHRGIFLRDNDTTTTVENTRYLVHRSIPLVRVAPVRTIRSILYHVSLQVSLPSSGLVHCGQLFFCFRGNSGLVFMSHAQIQRGVSEDLVPPCIVQGGKDRKQIIEVRSYNLDVQLPITSYCLLTIRNPRSRSHISAHRCCNANMYISALPAHGSDAKGVPSPLTGLHWKGELVSLSLCVALN